MDLIRPDFLKTLDENIKWSVSLHRWLSNLFLEDWMIRGLKGYVSRPQFRWKDADEIYIGAGSYHLYSSALFNYVVYWDSELTFQLGSGGSNATSDNLGASQWHYIYIDESAVIASNTNLLTAACFLNDTTAPTWSESYHGWYNGNDRCIFAVLTDGSNNVRNFYNDGGDLVTFDTIITEASVFTPSNTFTDIDLKTSMPGFSTKVLITVYGAYVDTQASFYMRPNGSSASVGRDVGYVTLAQQIFQVEITMATDSAQIIEGAWSGATAGDFVYVYTDGWFLPRGM